MMELVVTTAATRVQSSRQIATIITPTSSFYRPNAFQWPNQRQSNEGK